VAEEEGGGQERSWDLGMLEGSDTNVHFLGE
jgi:hypothetical protein